MSPTQAVERTAGSRAGAVRRALLLLGGCGVLGTGVAMLLTADLGADGFATLVNGTAIRIGTPFVVANAVISLVFLSVAAVGGLRQPRLHPCIDRTVEIAGRRIAVDHGAELVDRSGAIRPG